MAPLRLHMFCLFTELMFQVAIAELRKCNGDANLAVANLFAKSLSEGFNKKK